MAIAPPPPSLTPTKGVTTSEFWTHLLLTAVSTVIGFISLLHPGYKEPALIQALVPCVSLGVAVVLQIAYLIHRYGLKKNSLSIYLQWFLQQEASLKTLVSEVASLRTVVTAQHTVQANAPPATYLQPATTASQPGNASFQPTTLEPRPNS